MAKGETMKTLFIVSKGIGKKPDEVIRQLEAEDKEPRLSLMEKELNTTILDERYLETIPNSRKLAYSLLPIDLVLFLEAWVIHKQFDVVISYYERVGFPFALLQKFRGSNTPHIVLTTWFSSSEKAWFLQNIHDHLAQIITWSSNQYEFAIEQLQIPRENIKLIKRGTDQKFWRPISAETDRICSVGMEMRDYATLIDALKTLNISCHIATGTSRGQLFDTVKTLYEIDCIPGHVTVGSKSTTKLRELYAKSRFVVVPLLPTDTDNGITTILEAMAMGKPVICSRTEGQIDVIQDGVTGIFVPPNDPIAMRKAILELWNDPEKCLQMGIEARKYIEENHTLEKFVDDIKKEIELIIQGAPPKPQYVPKKLRVESN